MDFAKILAQLREELENLDAAIETLERLERSGRRRGRPHGGGTNPSNQGTSASAVTKDPGDARSTSNRRPRNPESDGT
jgi:hypothetical protein